MLNSLAITSPHVALWTTSTVEVLVGVVCFQLLNDTILLVCATLFICAKLFDEENYSHERNINRVRGYLYVSPWCCMYWNKVCTYFLFGFCVGTFSYDLAALIYGDCVEYITLSMRWMNHYDYYSQDMSCQMIYFTLKWAPFLVIYCIYLVVLICYFNMFCRQSHSLLYIDDEYKTNGDEYNFIDHDMYQNIDESYSRDPLVIDLNVSTECNDPPITGFNVINTISSYIRRFKLWFASKVNVSAQVIAAATNAIVSIVGTSITLISQSPNHGCQDQHTKTDSSGNTHTRYGGFNAECSLSTVTIGIGIFILFVIAFGYCARKCKCACSNVTDNRKQTTGHNQRCHCTMNMICGVFFWSLMDDHLRFTIVIKFIYFMLKPALIAITDTSSEDSDLIQTFKILYLILMFCSTTALAYMTFDKRYKTIIKLTNIMTNPSLFAKTYIVSYLTSIVATYTITAIIFVLSCTSIGMCSCNFLYLFLF